MINLHTDILSKVNADQLYLLCHIAKRIGKDMSCFPSNITLMEDTGWGRTKLKEQKQELVNSGLIKVTERTTASGQTSNLYTVTTDLIGVFMALNGKGDTPVASATPPGRHSDPPPVASATTEVLSIEVLKFNNNSQLQKLETWLSDIGTDQFIREAFTRARKVPAGFFSSYFELFTLEAKSKPETYHKRADVVNHFLSYSQRKYQIETAEAKPQRQQSQRFTPEPSASDGLPRVNSTVKYRDGK